MKGPEGWHFDLLGEFKPLPVINGHPGSFCCLLLREAEFFAVFFHVFGENGFKFHHDRRHYGGECFLGTLRLPKGSP